MHVLIIGCGASGAAAAIAAAEKGCRVTVLDRNRKILKKLGVTGNGRGNLMNLNPPCFFGDPEFAKKALDVVSPRAVQDFLEGLGLCLTHDEEGRVYPSSYMASVAVDALTDAMNRLGIQVHQNIEAEKIIAADGGFVVEGTESLYAPSKAKANGKEKKGELLSRRSVRFTADQVILAAGGKAAPAHGTDGSAYALATGLGHRLVAPIPALSPLVTEAKLVGGLEGVRVKAALRLVSAAGETLRSISGEALFTAGGVSGIAAMQLARFYQPGCTLSMDLTESITGSPHTDVTAWLEKRIHDRGNLPANRLLLGTAIPALQNALLNAAGLAALSVPCSALNSRQKAGLCSVISSFVLPVSGVRDFEWAQVTAGGIDTADVNPCTMESRLVKGLYLTGEILNVDGDCGGYNLLFAFASGLIAGKNVN